MSTILNLCLIVGSVSACFLLMELLPDHHRLEAIGHWVLDRLAGHCRHERRTFPMRGTQKCLECGAARSYPRIGATPGPWHKEVAQ